MKPGVRVMRGPDWCHGNQDGGEGFLGTVVKLYPSNCVLVRWDIGTETECRAGKDGAFDLRVFDNAPTGVTQGGITCNIDTKPVHGFRWRCLRCHDYDECTICHMTKPHDPSHPHVRYYTSKSTVVRVPIARRSRSVPVYGIFAGAQVTKVMTSSNDEDEKVGTVKEVIDLQPDGFRGAVRVEWPGMRQKKGEDGTTEYPIYRVGAEGRVELQAVKPVSIGNICIDHLPVLDLTVPDYIELKVGDKVIVQLNLDTFKALMKEHRPGGWDDRLETVLGEEGTVLDIQGRNLAAVKFETHTVTDMYINTLTKINMMTAGDYVKVIEDGEKMRRLQTGHGGWQDTFVYILGEEGRVVRMEGQTDALVEVNGKSYVLNQACLKLIRKGSDPSEEEEEDEASDISDAGYLSQMTIPKEAFRDKPPTGVSVGVGVRVVRGPDWSSDFLDQDGGEGHVGSITEICGVHASNQYPRGCVVVQWDNGEKNVYRASYEEKFDLRVYDNAGLGIVHEVQCSNCKVEKIYGMMWHCADCQEGEVTLCSSCYNADKHDVNHEFLRVVSIDDKGTKVPKRGMSKKVSASGIFEKCIVKRGPDWRWKDQDGGEGKQGEVIAIVNFSPDTDRDAAEVTWENGYTNVYRLGYKGRLDIVATKAVVEGTYYRDHIPVLKLTEGTVLKGVEPVKASSEAPKGAEAAVTSERSEENSRFKVGDKVKIDLDLEIVKSIEQKRGAWNDKMKECFDGTGTVLLTNGEDVTVDFEDAGRWTFHETVLTEMKVYKTGEMVVVDRNVHRVRMLQEDRGGWNELMEQVIGKKGVVEEVDEDGDIQVSFGDSSWTFNPECLSDWTGDNNSDPANEDQGGSSQHQSPARQQDDIPRTEEEQFDELFAAIFAGDLDRVNKIMEKAPYLLVMEKDGQRAIHVACNVGKIDIVRIFIKSSSKDVLLEMIDQEGNTPLLAAVKGNQMDMISYLVQEGSDKNAQNNSKQSAVHIAVSWKNVELLKKLCALEFDINLKDRLQQTALFDAVHSDNEEILDIVLDWPGLDLQSTDNIGFSPFLIACRKGSLKSVQKILQRCPQVLNSVKQDGFSGLHLAILNNQGTVLQFLLSQPDIDLSVKEKKNGRTPLHIACYEGWYPLVEMMVLKGADVHEVDSTGNSCLHLCFAETKTKTSKKDDETMLKMACFLVDHKADTELQDSDGKRPEQCAKAAIKERFQQFVLSKQNNSPKEKEEMDHTRGSPASTVPRCESLTSELNQGQGQDDVVINSKLPSLRIESLEQPTHSIIPQGEDDVKGQGQSEVVKKQIPEVCESCEEEPCRFKVEPCGHIMCGECIPRRKQKKQVCACCAENVQEIVDIQF